MKRPTIVVVGSSNTDMVIKSAKIPEPGETVLGGDFVMAAGGKGANQAVAAARLGADVVFVARVGKDLFGAQAIENFKAEGIRTDFVTQDDVTPSGVALILVDAAGENLISVAPGANAKLTTQDVIEASDAIASADALLLQLEVPVAVVERAVRIAENARVPVILNPAPAQQLPDSLLSGVSILTPNETEAELLTGVRVSDEESAQRAGRRLLGAGIRAVLVTRGSKGVLMITPTETQAIPAVPIKPVDTTAAGDAFNGALAVALGEGQELEAAVRFASAAGALAATRLGAQPSLPRRDELETFRG